MRVACTRCQTKYDVPDDKISRGAVKVRCSECGHVFVVRKRTGAVEETPAAEPVAPQEAKFEDFDFANFEESKETPKEPTPEATDTAPEQNETVAFGDDFAFSQDADSLEPSAAKSEADDDLGSLDDNLATIGELDLGEFDDLDQDLNLNDLDGLDLGEHEQDLAFPDEPHGGDLDEPMERVRQEDLIGPRGQETRVQGLADDMPRLDIQRGPRRAEGSSPSPVLPKDRRHSPFTWFVVIVAVATLGFTGYLLYSKRDAAFTFLSIEKIRSLWQRQTATTRLEAIDQRGFYKDLPAGRRVFVIQGIVVNRSGKIQSLIKVRGQLFGANGKTLASREVFCGNVLNEHELSTLPMETIEARLQNEVGEGLSNVDIAADAEVPFMVVFPSPPDGVEKFNISVIEARTGPGA